MSLGTTTVIITLIRLDHEYSIIGTVMVLIESFVRYSSYFPAAKLLLHHVLQVSSFNAESFLV